MAATRRSNSAPPLPTEERPVDVLPRAPSRNAWLLDELGEEERRRVEEVIEHRRCAAGEVLLEEGASSDAIHFIEKGTVEVCKRESSGDSAAERRHVIATLEADDFFGEMSFIDRQPPSATIRAKTPVTTWRLSKGALLHGDDPTGQRAYQRLGERLGRVVSQRLRATNESYVRSLRAELEAARLRNQFGHFLMVVIFSFALLNVATRFMGPALAPEQEILYTWGPILLLAPAPFVFMRRHDLPAASFGLHLRVWKRQLLEGGLFALAVITPLPLLKLTPLLEAGPLFTWRSVQGYTETEVAVFFVLYLPHCFLQELVARGMIQGSLRRFLDGSFWMPIVFTSLVFGVAHLYVSLLFGALTFLVSLYFGYIYARHGSLLGVTVAHYLAGVAAIAVGLF